MVALFEALAAIGLIAYLLQLLAAARFLRRRPPGAPSTEPISVLKPLCGADDELAVNLASFLDQTHPSYELLLGCASERDSAWPLARDLERRFPSRVRAILQRGEPGLNPKVNQLITLAREARHDLWVISDSNVRVGSAYLAGIAATMADPSVGLVTHPVVGAGGQTLGSRLDNLHLTSGVTLGVVAAKAAVGEDVVVGKSMTLRRRDVEALGGFESVQDLLAEDYVLGRRVSEELGLQVVVRPEPVLNISRRAPLAVFLARYRRWSVMQRQTVGLPLYALQALLLPSPWALAALLASPGRSTALALAICVVARAVMARRGGRLLGGGPSPGWSLVLSPLAELMLTGCWLYGLAVRRIDWRGHLLRVHPGSRLEALPAMPAWKAEPAAAAAK